MPVLLHCLRVLLSSHIAHTHFLSPKCWLIRLFLKIQILGCIRLDLLKYNINYKKVDVHL